MTISSIRDYLCLVCDFFQTLCRRAIWTRIVVVAVGILIFDCCIVRWMCASFPASNCIQVSQHIICVVPVSMPWRNPSDLLRSVNCSDWRRARITSPLKVCARSHQYYICASCSRTFGGPLIVGSIHWWSGPSASEREWNNWIAICGVSVTITYDDDWHVRMCFASLDDCRYAFEKCIYSYKTLSSL